MKKNKLFSLALSVLLLNTITIPQTAMTLDNISTASWQDKKD